jgi:hypothetical protein
VLMYSSFGKDVDPGVFSGGVEGGAGEGVEIVGAIGQGASCEGVGGVECVREVGRWLRERLGGEQSDRLGHGRLEEASVRRVCAAVGREDLAVAEKCREKSGGILVSARVAFER